MENLSRYGKAFLLGFVPTFALFMGALLVFAFAFDAMPLLRSLTLIKFAIGMSVLTGGTFVGIMWLENRATR